MNTNQIKKFATLARTELLKGVSNKLKAYFDEKGNPHIVPQPIQGGCVYGEQIFDETFYRAWQSLNKNITLYGFRVTVEEVAYTWFNRLVAINILAKNSLAEPVLQFTNPVVRVPHIVELARSGQVPDMSVNARRALNELLDDDSKIFEQFAFLIDCYCSANPIISKCFGKVDDYSFLLLPNNILAEGELVDMLNSSDIINDEDYRSPELIGWLYQFYISERKDEVFAKKGKFESDEIPAATQIFTPNWIVKYMVQNSLGRIYLDSEPYSGITENMQYLVETEQGTDKFAWSDVKELTCADLACGSGHILNECFDLLYDIYIEQGYSRREAIESIFAHNLVGIDIDTRAKQMATFALLLKACRRDASFADAHAMPRVYDMPDPYPHKLNLHDTLAHFFLGGNEKMISETTKAIELFDEAKNLGSIMKFDISPSTREAIVRRLSEYRAAGHTDIDSLFRYLDIILALTDKYASLVMNPPYMGGGNMNPVLSKYVKDNYEEGKADLFSTFMLVAIDRLASKGKYGMINMHSWMFLSSYENLRIDLLEKYHIDSLLHLGAHAFDEIGGEVVQCATFTIAKHKPSNDGGVYYRLVDGRNSSEKENAFLRRENGFYGISQSNFEKIPGNPVAYWISQAMLSVFLNRSLGDDGEARQGMATGDNNRFLRLWPEVGYEKIMLNASSNDIAINSGYKWFPHNKGGKVKWYGDNDYVIAFDEENYNLLLSMGNHLPSRHLYFKQCLSWSVIASTAPTFRYIPDGYTFNMCGMSYFRKSSKDLFISLGYVNSKLFRNLVPFINPTINLSNGDFARIPNCSLENTEHIVEDNIHISKIDWDAHETSWDFKENELIRMKEFCGMNCADLDMLDEEDAKDILKEFNIGTNSNLIEHCYWCYMSEWTKKFRQLHANEEELNRQFIEIYGLQDELTPDVPLDEITILQQGEISIENGQIVWHKDVIIKQLISYAIGCWFGRYRLDKPGLHIAHPTPTDEELATYTYRNNEVEIDDDGIIPVLSTESSFADNACHRLRDFLRIVFGEETLIENINFIEAALGKSIEAYFLKDFWKDHKKMYQNRPIYWLFSSKKGAFQCLAYMHRMDAYTAERVRSKYLLPHMESLGVRITEFVANEAMLSTAQRRTLDRLIKELEECREYHDRLHLVADKQIAFDLDDGVVVNYAKFGDVLSKIK